MQRRVTVTVIVLLFVGLGALGYFLQQKKEVLVTSPYGAVPTDAAMVVEVVDMPLLFGELARENDIIREISGIPGLDSFAGTIHLIDSLVHTRTLGSITGSGKVLISFHLLGRDRVIPLFSITSPPEIRDRHLREVMAGIDGTVLSEREYEGIRIHALARDGDKEPLLYAGWVRGVIVVSSSSIILEAAIRQTAEEEDIRSLPGFGKVLSAAGKNDTKLFIIFNNFRRVAAILTGSSEKGLAEAAGTMASCAGLDFFPGKNGFSMSGYIEPADSSGILAPFRVKSTGSFESREVIPAGAALFEVITSGSFVPGRRAGISETVSYFADIVKAGLDNEIARVYLDIQGEAQDNNRIMIFRLKGRDAIEMAFRKEIEANRGNGASTISYKPDDQSEHIIYYLPADGLSKALCGNFAGSYGGRYVTFYENFMITGRSSKTLSKFIYDNILNRTIANDIGYREFESTMPSRFSYFFYAIPSQTIPLLEGLLKENIVDGFKNNSESLRKINGVGLQLVPSNEMIYSTLSVSYTPEVREEASSRWESLIDTILYSKPLFFTNHYTGRDEIFVQDMNNNVYLINEAGRILWKQRLTEKIMGDPYMVDYYRNGKYQILFATTNYLHLLDRNGNYVERYPVRLRSPATNGLALFDYEGNGDYRLFVCGTDKQVYAYDKSGNVVRGWNRFTTSGIVRQEVEFFRVSGKDYLVVSDDNTIYILDRQGDTRVGVKEPVQRAERSTLELTDGSNPRIVLTEPDGTLKFISFTGDVESAATDQYSKEHIFEYFDIDADGEGEYIYIDSDRLVCYDDDRSRIFSLKLDSENIEGPFGLVFSSNDKKLGFVDRKNGTVHLIDHKGREVSGFPLPGYTSFSVGKFSPGTAFNLITGGADGFIYNYEIVR
ncbi:MAG: hypothetical protein LC649_07200 [Bacteroidales bacterium]|nr:hypothetical protein [Bacteroidales bacterium]